MDEQLVCSVCLDTFTNPKILPCFHVYCEKCLKRLVERDDQGQLVVACPVCRKTTPLPVEGVAGLQSAFHINRLMEFQQSFRKVLRQPSEPRLERSAGGTITKPTPKKRSDSCSEHSREILDLFCEKCGGLACRKCFAKGEKHQGHDFITVSDAFEKTKAEIIAAMEPMEKQLSTINDALKDMDDRHGAITDQRAAIEAEIHEAVDRLQDTLSARKAELLSQLDQVANEKLKSLAAQHDQIERSQTRLDGSLQFVRESLRTSKEGEIVMMKSTLVKQVKDLTSATFQPESLKPSVETDITFTLSAEVGRICQNYGKVSMKGLGLPDFSKCRIAGKGLSEATINEESSVVFSALNSAGKPCDWEVENLACEIISELTGAKAKGAVQQRGKNDYVISYRPVVKGRHRLGITVDGKHIVGSPFGVGVRASPGATVIGDPIAVIGNLKRPWGVAATLSGELVVSEYDNHCVSIFNLRGEKILSFGSLGRGTGQMDCPCGVALDDIGNIFVADSHNHRIQKFSADGQFLAIMDKAGLRSSMPVGIAFNPVNKRLYVVDAGINITVLNSDLSVNYGTFGKFGIAKGQLNKPYNIACDANGKVYVADTENHRVQIFSADGKFLKAIGKHGSRVGDLKKPVGIAVGRDGEIYVSEEENRRISVFSAEGQFMNSFGYSKVKAKAFNGVRSLAVDRDGVVYVCDRENWRVLIF